MTLQIVMGADISNLRVHTGETTSAAAKAVTRVPPGSARELIAKLAAGGVPKARAPNRFHQHWGQRRKCLLSAH